IQTLNYEQLLNKIGLASVVFKSGKFKDMLNGARPITPEERELVQNFIMSTYDKFLGIVAKERNLPADLLRNTIADGRILSGKEALQNKLIDGLGELDDAFAKARQLGNAPDAKVVKYGPPFSLSRLLRVFGESESKIELQLPKQLVPQLESGRAFFLPEAVLASVLIFFFLLTISSTAPDPALQFHLRNLLANFLFSAFVLFVIMTLVQFRGFDLGALAGFFRISFFRTLGTGAI